jgi:hypothetical protein
MKEPPLGFSKTEVMPPIDAARQAPDEKCIEPFPLLLNPDNPLVLLCLTELV